MAGAGASMMMSSSGAANGDDIFVATMILSWLGLPKFSCHRLMSPGLRGIKIGATAGQWLVMFLDGVMVSTVS
jgi:hypothetical protein